MLLLVMQWYNMASDNLEGNCTRFFWPSTVLYLTLNSCIVNYNTDASIMEVIIILCILQNPFLM